MSAMEYPVLIEPKDQLVVFGYLLFVIIPSWEKNAQLGVISYLLLELDHRFVL